MVLELADNAFREITGLNHSMFGGVQQSQDRSAEATKSREGGLSRRPDDYADTVEAWMSAASASEAIATRLLVGHETVAPLFGEDIMDDGMGGKVYGPLTRYWIELIETDDPWNAAAELSYTVEAGSGRRRNKQLLQANAQQLYTMLGNQFYAFGQQSQNYDPFLALVRLVGDAYDMPVEPLIEKFRQALLQNNQQMMMQQQQMMGGQPSPAQGMEDQSSSLGNSAGGPPRMRQQLPPPPGTM